MATLQVALEPGVNGKHLYYPGQTLKGVVQMSLNYIQKLRGLYIELSGKAKTHWTESHGKSSTHYEGVEVYLNSRTYLFGQSGGPSLKIEPGKHNYNFSFKLPPQLPYSLDVRHAEICYKIKVVLDIPWEIDEVIKIPFTVLPRLVLSSFPDLNRPCSLEKVERFFSFSESKPLKILVMFPYIGLVAGDDFSFTIKFENQSKVDILGTNVRLKQFLTFYSNGGKKKEKKEKVASSSCGGADAGTSSQTVAKLRIPNVLISNEQSCKVIVVKYYLKIEFEASGLHSNPEFGVPVTIGTVRSENRESQNVPRPVDRSAVAGPSAPPDKKDLPPPFEEAINMPRVNIPTSSMNFGYNEPEKS